jgi:predicted dehydrogenase
MLSKVSFSMVHNALPKGCPMNVVFVGGGNITRTRHIPSVNRLGYVALGIIGVNADAVDASWRIARGARCFTGDISMEEGPDWLSDADLFIIGTPPRTHVPLIQSLIRFERARILSEKPFVVTDEEAHLLRASPLDGVGVMHNFQFASGYLRAKTMIAEGKIGDICSIQALQWSTKDRRLPDWYRDLPLGLFWDESAHFVYLVNDLVGDLSIDRAWAAKSSDSSDPTPSVIGAFFNSASGIPVEMSMHFEAAISEWGLVIAGSRGTLLYDLFRDISVLLPHDGLHTARQILRTSALATAQHWYFTFVNGQRYLRKKHLYGVDQVIRRVADSRGAVSGPVSAHAGLSTTETMRSVVNEVLG